MHGCWGCTAVHKIETKCTHMLQGTATSGAHWRPPQDRSLGQHVGRSQHVLPVFGIIAGLCLGHEQGAQGAAHRNLGGAVTREQHVSRLHVKVDDALVVQVVQPARNLQRDPPAPAQPRQTLLNLLIGCEAHAAAQPPSGNAAFMTQRCIASVLWLRSSFKAFETVYDIRSTLHPQLSLRRQTLD